jgi:hypothetical protein
MNRFIGAPAAARPKPFSWSYSRLKNFETCAYRHEQIDIEKTVSEAESDELRDGNEAHDVLARAITGTPLPAKWERYQPWVDRLISRGNDQIFVEQQLAIAEDHEACEWFARAPRAAWYRAKVDYLKIVGRVGLAVDWKTGKRIEDSVQLALTAACVFAHYPQVEALRTEFVWLKEGVSLENTTREDFTPADMPDLWSALEPRIEALRYAWEQKSYPPNPGRLCRKYCPVSQCQYHGKSF